MLDQTQKLFVLQTIAQEIRNRLLAVQSKINGKVSSTELEESEIIDIAILFDSYITINQM
jgi:hypothetical protein